MYVCVIFFVEAFDQARGRCEQNRWQIAKVTGMSSFADGSYLSRSQGGHWTRGAETKMPNSAFFFFGRGEGSISAYIKGILTLN